MIEIHIEKKRDWESGAYLGTVSSNVGETIQIIRTAEQDLDSRIVDAVTDLLRK